MDTYIEVLKIILKNNEEFKDIINIMLIKIFDTYFLERNIQKYNIDNVFKKYNIYMYNLLEKKYSLTKSNRLIFKKHKYNKKEYVIYLLKKYNIKSENYKNIANEILKKDIKS